jgi:hypothetical protein
MNSKLGVFLLAAQILMVLAPAPLQTELAKMDHLVQHFIEHRKQSSELSFLSFLSLHYGESFSQHQDDHNHANLPGKDGPTHKHAILCGCLIPDLPENPILELHLPPSQPKELLPADDSETGMLLASGIWQPPRIG